MLELRTEGWSRNAEKHVSVNLCDSREHKMSFSILLQTKLVFCIFPTHLIHGELFREIYDEVGRASSLIQICEGGGVGQLNV